MNWVLFWPLWWRFLGDAWGWPDIPEKDEVDA